MLTKARIKKNSKIIAQSHTIVHSISLIDPMYSIQRIILSNTNEYKLINKHQKNKNKINIYLANWSGVKGPTSGSHYLL